MDDQELLELMKDLESDRVERKESLSDSSKIREAICAFANDLPDHRKPGVLFIGVKDNGPCASLTIDDALLCTLADMRSDGNIIPFPHIEVQKRKLAGCELAVIIVYPSEAPPVRYKQKVCIRVGPRRAVATAQEERRLTEKRRSKDLPFDLTAVSSATTSDLDQDLFIRTYLPSAVSPEVMVENNRNLEQQLASLRMIASTSSPCPTVLGILALGSDPRRYLPGAYIQFLRLDGIELTDPIKDQKEIDGPLTDMLGELNEVFAAHISVATFVTGQEVETQCPDYPIDALRQLAYNAVLHRVYEATHTPVKIYWFSDRIEISSPGGPFGLVNEKNFGTGVTDYRNPHLAEAMKNLGYVQKFGLGIQMARKSLEKNGNPPPAFEVNEAYVLVTIRRPK